MNDAYKRLTVALLYGGVLALFAALATYFVGGTFGNVPKILAIVGVGLLAGYFVASPDTVLGAFRGRGLKYGGNTMAMVVLFVGIVGAGNYFVNNHNQTYDVTQNHAHTLSPQTIKLLKNLKQPITVTAFFQTGQFNERQARDLLGLYRAQSSKVKVTFVDPDKDPATAQRFGITSYGTTVFQSGSRRKDVSTVGEQEFTSAIIAVTGQLQRKIYFITGNGQPDPKDTGRQGYNDAMTALKNDNYVAGTLGATLTSIPPDAAAIILAAGNQPLLAPEKAAISAYLQKGGKMLVMSGAFGENDLNTLIKPLGLSFQQGITIDPASSAQQDPTSPAVSHYTAQGSGIVKNLPVTLFPVSSGVTIAKTPPQGITANPVAKTSGQSWLQNHKDQAQFRPGDTRGPITLVATAEGTLPKPSASPSASAGASASASPGAIPSSGALANPSIVATPPPASATPAASGTPGASAQPTMTPTPTPKVAGASVNLKGGTRVVAVADEAWINNTYLNVVPGNRDLFLNSIDYLVGNQALISITPKPQPNTQMFLLGSDANLILLTTVILVPLAVLVAGGFVWWQRR
ncbi:MAG: GldG family protein [Chloroflexota bacterium]